MKRQLSVALATVTILAAHAVTAQAQDTTKARTDTVMKVRTDTVRKESQGEVANLGSPTFAGLLAAINAMPTTITKLGSLTNLTAERVHLVDVKGVIHGGNEAEFSNISTQNHDTLSKLHSIVKENAVIFGAMRTHPAKIDVDEVVAATVDDNGDVWVYYRKK